MDSSTISYANYPAISWFNKETIHNFSFRSVFKVVLENSIKKFACRKFISNENSVENRPKWWLFFRKSWNQVPDSKFKISTFIFRKLDSIFLDFLF